MPKPNGRGTRDAGSGEASKPYIECPFCGEGDFDLIGLKGHLEHGDCKPFNELETPRRLW